MKWVWRIGAGFLVFVVMVLVFVQYTVQRQKSIVNEFANISTEELIERIESDREEAAPGDEAAEGLTGEGDVSEEATDATSHETPQLMRAATREEIAEHFHFGGRLPDPPFDKLQAKWGVVLTSVGKVWLNSSSASAGLDSAVGVNLVMVDEFEDGETYLRSSLANGPTHPGNERRALGTLAWLEPDPDKAARLLELSYNEDDPDSNEALYNAVKLCEVTGSDELAEHYRKLIPEAEARAAAYREQLRREMENAQ